MATATSLIGRMDKVLIVGVRYETEDEARAQFELIQNMGDGCHVLFLSNETLRKLADLQNAPE